MADALTRMSLLVLAEYSFGNDRIILSLRNANDSDFLAFVEGNLEADERFQKEAIVGNTQFFSMSNVQSTSLSWIDATTCIAISGDFSPLDADTMIDSME